MFTRSIQALAVLCVALPAAAQDRIQFHEVTIKADGNVDVVYSKNFATCAHMRFSNSSCTQYGSLTHRQNLFCRSGNNVTVTTPLTSFGAGFGPGIWVFMHHGNNGNVRSSCLQVGCDGSYGVGCAGTGGIIPTLVVDPACPGVGTTVRVSMDAGLPGAPAAIVLGFSRASIPVLGCNLLVFPTVGSVSVVLSATGSASFQVPIPLTASGAVVQQQGIAIDAGSAQGISATNGYEIKVQ